MRIPLILFFFLMFLAPLSAQWTLERELFIPPEYYVGDETQLDLVLHLDSPAIVEPPVVIPQQDWVEIINVQVYQEEDTVRVQIRFRSYYPGNRTLPSMQLGEITLEGISLFTSSISEQSGVNTIRGLRDPFQLPGAVVLLFLLVLLILLLPPLLFFLIRFLIRRIRVLLERFRKNAPFRRFSRLLVQLQLEEFQQDPQDFYTKLSGGLRNYLSGRTQMDYTSCTTRELSRKSIPGIQTQEWQTILAILKKSDMVKYAGERASQKVMKVHLKNMEDFSIHWEEEEHFDYL